VRTIGRLPGIVKVGHGGTLDPAAEGVLPILINAATRLADFVHLWRKTYIATIAFGATSDTYDREGVLTPGGETAGLSAERISAELPGFSGRIDQVPPMHSALKLGGEPLYRKARRGETVARVPRVVVAHAIRLLDYDPGGATGRLEIVCGQGFYVRSLAQDLGERLGTGAYLAALTRTAYGPLQLEDAVTPAAVTQTGPEWLRLLRPLDLPLQDWPALRLDEVQAAAVAQGRSVQAGMMSAGRVRLLDVSGSLLAWGVVGEGGWVHPKAVFPQ
jgi:tRNA pseudouridine55 synthase